ncbi:Dyp-type peroxidase [Streptomyces polyrhachis]|uniref:Dyp-type peroxidase n=1 Tax=Streptomyces polyrhachis TaxID=1282885 RepID=A0ABW2GJD8_9ACTN
MVVYTQPITVPPAEAALFLVVTINPGKEGAVRSGLEQLPGLTRSVRYRLPENHLSRVVGISDSGYRRLFDGPRPRYLRPFQALEGPRHKAPATPGDLLFHLRAKTTDLCFELGKLVMEALGDSVTTQVEVHGFRYFDERDLLGFVDGSENPTGPPGDASVYIGDEDPHFRGGSYVITQKYLHDLTTWQAMTVEQQEMVIGRHKQDDVEFPDSVKPADAHIVVNTITVDGVQHKIVRDNMPFAEIGKGEFGTFFIGYSRNPEVTELMLQRMFIGEPVGNTDRILEVSTAKTGTLFFVPSEDFLDNLPDAPAHPDTSESTAPPLTMAQLKEGIANEGFK